MAILVQSVYDMVYNAPVVQELKNNVHYGLPYIRSEEYCNKPTPNGKIDGLEGVHPVPSMTLLGAVILIRHGDRLPISRPPVALHHPIKKKSCSLDHRTHPSTPLLFPFISTISKYERSIRDSLNPHLQAFSLLPNTCSDISITQAGVVQMLNLGNFLGGRYMKNGYGNNQEIMLSTSRFSRTYQCLLPFMFGFAKDNFTEILSNGIDSSSSIYFCDGDKSDSPSFHSNCTCPNAINIPNLRRSLRYWNRTKLSIHHLYQLLQLEKCSTSTPEQPAISPSRVWDWLVSDYYCSGLKLPCFPTEDNMGMSCLNETIVSDLIHLVDENQKQMVTNSEYIKGASLVVYPLLTSINKKFHDIISNCKNASENGKMKDPYLWIISSHDVTMGPLFTALQKMSLRKVPYASRLVFELWVDDFLQSDSNKGNVIRPYIRILLNGEDISEQTSICKHCEASESKYCTLDCFNVFLNKTFFDNVGSDDFRTACVSYA